MGDLLFLLIWKYFIISSWPKVMLKCLISWIELLGFSYSSTFIIAAFLGDTGFFPTKDMQTPSLRSGHLYMKDRECAESNEKSYFRPFWSIVFESLAPIRLQNFVVVQKWPNLQGRLGLIWQGPRYLYVIYIYIHI